MTTAVLWFCRGALLIVGVVLVVAAVRVGIFIASNGRSEGD